MRLALGAALTVLCLTPPAFAADRDVEEAARGFVSLLGRKEFRQAAQRFDATMAKEVAPDKLAALWTGLTAEAGDFQGIDGTRSEVVGRYRAAFVTCEFRKKRLDVKVVFDAEGRIAGMFFVPTQGFSCQVPGYARRDTFTETEVRIGRGEGSLPGTLATPVGKGPFPAVILVHGSGPQDRDETIGPNKPFRDLAWGLASRGIVVLRYEKRTRHDAARLAAGVENFTVRDETIADVSEAVSLLRQSPSVDGRRIFVLGHSLGGMLVPRIARDNEAIAGFVIMAANARPLEDLVLEQTLFQASLKGELSAEEKAGVEEVRTQVAAIKALSGSASAPPRILGAPGSYWRDLQGYRPAAAAKAIARPMLILQGGKDCQVSPVRDFEEWRRELAGRRDVEFRLYAELNHLFMDVGGRSTGAEYQRPGNVAETVVKDTADWIAKHGLRR